MILWILKPYDKNIDDVAFSTYKFDPMDFETFGIDADELLQALSINLILWILKHSSNKPDKPDNGYKFDPMDFETTQI